MYCIYCGHKNDDDASFCTKCGKALEHDETGENFGESGAPGPDEAAEGVTQTPSTDEAQEPPVRDIFQMPPLSQEPRPDGNVQKKKTGLLVGLILGAGVLVIMIIVICLLIFGGRNSQSYQKQMDIGEQYFQEADYNAAIEAFREAIKIDETRSGAYTRLCDAYIALGDYNRAREVIDYGVTVVDDPKELQDKEAEIDSYLANGNPGSDTVVPDTQAEDGSDAGETQIPETQAEPSREETLPREETETAAEETSAGETTVADGDTALENPWVTTYNDLYFGNGHFVVVDADSIDVFNEALEPVFHYDSEDTWYLSTAVTNGTTLYVAANHTSEDGMTGSSVIYSMDIASGSMETLYSNDIRNIYLGGCANDRLYYYSSTAQDWMNPGIYYFDLARPSEHFLDIQQSYVEYVGSDFFVTTGQRSDVSPVPVDIYDLDGGQILRLTERGQSFEVRGRTVYYTEVTDPQGYYPCMLKAYDIDTGETRTLAQELYIMDFDVCRDSSGIWALADIDSSEEAFTPDTLVKVDFESGEMQQIYSDSDSGFTFKEVNGYMYIFSGQEMLIYEPEFENAYTVHTLGTDEYFRGFLHVGDAFYLCYINAAGENILILLQ